MDAGVAAQTTPLSRDEAYAATTLRDEASAPRLIIKMETIEPFYSSSTLWRGPRTYAPLTPAERAEYYKAYDPMTGLKIAATLSGLLTMAVLYVFYKVIQLPDSTMQQKQCQRSLIKAEQSIILANFLLLSCFTCCNEAVVSSRVHTFKFSSSKK